MIRLANLVLFFLNTTNNGVYKYTIRNSKYWVYIKQ